MINYAPESESFSIALGEARLGGRNYGDNNVRPDAVELN
jgi:hypothetical protein